ncbi:hypothetical protein OsI_33463 [Oryza sativa Indica Group]|uniref:Uncharacterized protein n=1 Tax=Oryza sativa subsp. indica TaxID=39946 RepID=B8BGP2_ORYSI|nr:hypothetical protein OsI_33463 [Oryza sativa Indica Group]
MSFGAVDVDDGSAAATAAASGGEEVRAMPAEVSWEMLDKSRFFLLGAALFSGVSAALYPAVVLKTHLQVSPPPAAAASTTAAAILRRHGSSAPTACAACTSGFGVSVLTYAPSSAAWWASYATAQRLIWRALGPAHHDSRASVVAVQGASAAAAGGAAALVTMPLDTVKTRLQVMDGGGASLASEARALVREGGWGACYRGLGPRWASMSLSAATMVTAYEFLKRLSTKDTSL